MDWSNFTLSEMLPPFLLLFIGLLPVSLGRNFLSANAFLDVDKITSRAAVKITINGNPHCSGTIISSNIVYTAAHCLHGYSIGSLGVHTSADLERGYELEEVYIPEEYMEAADFRQTVKSFCDPNRCNMECRRNNKMEFYGNHYDYGLILLKEELPICADPEGPVAAAFQYPLVSKFAHRYSPGKDGNECFVAGFGDTEHNPSKAGNISLAIISHFDGLYKQKCDQATEKGVFTRFHTSNESNPYETEVCGGDSGSGVQCISRGGKHLGVIGVNIQVLPFQDEYLNLCTTPRDSISLSINDHAKDLFDAIGCWGETENFDKWKQTCSAFLEANPYNSVMAHYLKRPAEFK